MTNALAYYKAELITTVKSFIVQVPASQTLDLSCKELRFKNFH